MQNSTFLSTCRTELSSKIIVPLEQIRALEARCCELVEHMANLGHSDQSDEILRAQCLAELQQRAQEVKQLKADPLLRSKFELYKTLTEHMSNY